MVNEKINIHNRSLGARKKALEYWKIEQDDKKDLIKFLEDCSIGKVNKGKRINETRLIKYLDLLKVPLEFFKVSTKKISVEDMENFEKGLISDKIKKLNKKPFSAWTKLSMKQAIKIYLRWKLPSEKYVKLTDWIDTTPPKRTPDYLTEQEIEKLYKASKTAQERYLIAVLFCSGARAEEFFNIRYEDIKLPSDKNNYVRLTLKAEYSKTEGRVISLYWKHCLESVRDYLKEREQQGIKPTEQIFINTYDNARQFLNRFGSKVLGRSIHFHLFRHSSATFYATKLNRQELCYRYGWKFSSEMPDVYISRSGMISKELDEKFKSTELEEIKKDFELKDFKREKQIEELNKKYNSLIEQIKFSGGDVIPIDLDKEIEPFEIKRMIRSFGKIT